ncbi:MAG: hypothetical protein OHK0053_30820 [Microscillaceae bacterium]
MSRLIVLFIKILFLGSLGLLSLFPLLFFLGLSLSREWFYPNFWPSEWGLERWLALGAEESPLGHSLLLSLLISLGVAGLATGAGFLSGRQIAFSPHKAFLLRLAYFPYILSPVVYGACLNYYFVYADLSGRVAGVVLAQFIIAYPFAVILYSGYWNQHLRAMEGLVATLGGRTWQTYFWVIIPLSRNILLLGFFQTFLISWFEYGLTRLIGLGQVPTLTILVFQYIGEADLHRAALAACALMAPPLLLLWLNRQFVLKNTVSDA